MINDMTEIDPKGFNTILAFNGDVDYFRILSFLWYHILFMIHSIQYVVGNSYRDFLS